MLGLDGFWVTMAALLLGICNRLVCRVLLIVLFVLEGWAFTLAFLPFSKLKPRSAPGFPFVWNLSFILFYFKSAGSFFVSRTSVLMPFLFLLLHQLLPFEWGIDDVFDILLVCIRMPYRFRWLGCWFVKKGLVPLYFSVWGGCFQEGYVFPQGLKGKLYLMTSLIDDFDCVLLDRLNFIDTSIKSCVIDGEEIVYLCRYFLNLLFIWIVALKSIHC